MANIMRFGVGWPYPLKKEDPGPPPGIAPPIRDICHAAIALVTTGGIVPYGNPDHIESSAASHYGVYDIAGVMDLTEGRYATAHGGYDPTYANSDADRVLPVDVMRDCEKEGVIGILYDYFYTTVGNGMAVATSKIMGTEIGIALKEAGVDGVILTSTCGTCTRAGATIAKEIERIANIPVVMIAVVTPIAIMIGANRVVPGVAIAHPLGNPALTMEEEKVLRWGIVNKALQALETEITGPTVFE